MEATERRTRALRALMVLLLGLVAASVFFRRFVWSGFGRIQIVGGDSDLAYVIAEHWYRWMHGLEGWRDVPYFHPVHDTLGYTDAQVLFAPPYAIFRALGADMFLALQLVAVVVVAIGYVSTYVLLRRHLRVRVGFALVGAVAFSCSNALAIKAFHMNTLGVEFVPLIVLLGCEGVRAMRAGRAMAAVVWSGAAGLLWGLLFFTSYYSAWFSVVVAFAVLIVGVLLAPRRALAFARRRRGDVRRWLPSCIASAAAFAVGVLPFLLTSIPVLRESGGRSWSEVLGFLARPSDVFNLGHANLVWGGITWPGTTPAESVERALAVTPLLTVGAIVGVVLLRVLEGRQPGMGCTARTRWLTAALLASFALTALSWRFGDHSAWKVLWAIVPGGRAIRAVDRVQLVLSFVYVVVWAAAMDGLWTRLGTSSRRARLVGCAAIVALSVGVLVEQVTTQVPKGFDHAVRQASLDAVAAPPTRCRSFVVIDPEGRFTAERAQLQSMVLAVHLGLPTLNGDSGNVPPGWNLWTPSDPRYPEAVQRWAVDHGLDPDTVCAFDLDTGQWVP